MGVAKENCIVDPALPDLLSAVSRGCEAVVVAETVALKRDWYRELPCGHAVLAERARVWTAS